MNVLLMNSLLTLTAAFLSGLNLQTIFLPLQEILDNYPDLGLRRRVLQTEADFPFLEGLDTEELCRGRTFWFFIDRFDCHYLAIPVMQEDVPFLFLSGPYLTQVPEVQNIQALCRRQNIPLQSQTLLFQYFSTLPQIGSESMLESYLRALGLQLYQGQPVSIRYFQEQEDAGQDFSAAAQPEGNEDTADRLELRYQIEEQLMDAIARGDVADAERCQASGVFDSLDRRFPNPVRDQKNYMIILNTLCRKAAQRGGVHPVYLDELSRKMALEIENITSGGRGATFSKEMVRKYCLLVQSRATSGYTPVIQKAVIHIIANLSDPSLSLQEVAQQLNINKSYLATLFKKETGATLTSYVNARRIDQAIFLLNTQDLPVQDIAAAVGLPDTTWFIRVFKREKGMTPAQYRKMIRTI